MKNQTACRRRGVDVLGQRPKGEMCSNTSSYSTIQNASIRTTACCHPLTLRPGSRKRTRQVSRKLGAPHPVWLDAPEPFIKWQLLVGVACKRLRRADEPQLPFHSIMPSMALDILSAARSRCPASRCAYRSVLAARRCPSSFPVVARLSPDMTAWLA